MDEHPQLAETAWLTVADIARFERVSRMEVYRRMQAGDARYLISKDRREIDGKPGRLIHARSMTFDAQMRWREHVLGQAMKPKAENAEIPTPATSTGEMTLFPQTEVDKQIAALGLSESERGVVLRRYRIVDLCLNHNWKSEGYASKRQYMSVLAKRNYTTARSIQRWVAAWEEHESLIDLVADRPGPPPGSGTVLDADMRAHLRDCWVFRKLTVRQSYDSLVRYLQGKQNSVGCRVDTSTRSPAIPLSRASSAISLTPSIKPPGKARMRSRPRAATSTARIETANHLSASRSMNGNVISLLTTRSGQRSCGAGGY